MEVRTGIMRERLSCWFGVAYEKRFWWEKYSTVNQCSEICRMAKNEPRPLPSKNSQLLWGCQLQLHEVETTTTLTGRGAHGVGAYLTSGSRGKIVNWKCAVGGGWHASTTEGKRLERGHIPTKYWHGRSNRFSSPPPPGKWTSWTSIKRSKQCLPFSPKFPKLCVYPLQANEQ